MEKVNNWLTPLNTALIVLVFVLTLVGGNQSAPAADQFGTDLASVNWFQRGIGWFAEGLYVGDTQEFHVDSDGNVTTGGTFTTTGAATFSSTAAFTGVATFAAQPVYDGGVLYSSTLATSSAGAATYTAANITGKSTILHNATAALAATLPATSTLTSFVPNTGDRTSLVLVNIGAGALTLAGGAGMNFYNASTSAVLQPTSAGLLEFVRQADTDIAVFFTPGA